MTNTQEKTINEQFEKFLNGSKRFKVSKLKEIKQGWYLEYDTFFVDDYDTTGWIYYKPLFSKYAWFYMFKGKPYQPLYWKPLAWWHFIRRFKRHLIELQYKYIEKKKPDYSMRNLAEWYIIKNLIVIGLVCILAAGGYLAYTKLNPEDTEMSIQNEVLENTDISSTTDTSN